MIKDDLNTPKRTEVSDIGKIALTNKLLSKLDNTISDTITYGDTDNYQWINSHRLLLEGIDFDLIYMPLKYLGYKSLILALGPIYSKCFVPDNVSIQIGLSKRFSVEDIEELWLGISACMEEHKIKKVNLELLPSLTGLAISISSQGKQKKDAFVHKPKASATDLICLTGNLGAAYMGLQLLEREKALFQSTSSQPKLDNYKFILKSYLNPQLNISLIGEMQENNIIPSHGEFIIRGLADAVKMMCHSTGCGAKIFLNKIPISSQTFEMAEEINIDATTAALNGGEDIQFIFSIPISEYEKIQKELPQLDIIGHLCSQELGTKLISPDGLELELKAQAWSE